MELKKIVNIMKDEKFLDYYITMSERFMPNESSYVFFTETSEFKYIHSNNMNIIKIHPDRMLSEDVIIAINSSEKVILHSFDESLLEFINKIYSKTLLIWLFWGWEGYITQKRITYLEKITRKIRFEKSFIGFLKYLKNYLYNDLITLSTGKRHIDIINKMDYCATWVTEDYNLAKSINPNIKFIHFNYYTEELMNFPKGGEIDKSFQKIMLGNSGSPLNNHAEALYYLKEINFDGKIYCPLSYGGNTFYRNNIEKLGEKFFGNNFIPLKDFMPLNQYQSILNSCDVIWMNHKRQQAAGNIFAGFCMGKIVILHQNNPMNSTFKMWNIKFFYKEVLQKKTFNKFDLETNIRLKERLSVEANRSFFKFLKSSVTK